MSGFAKADFEPYIGTTFQVSSSGMAPVFIDLIEIKDTSSGAVTGFSLLFRGKTDSLFRHNTYTVRHPALGELELFLGPVHTGKTDAVYFQAVFSTLKEAAAK